MAKLWRPGKVLVPEAIKLQRRVAAAISSARSRVPHREARAGQGGSLVSRVRSRDLLIKGKAHAGVAWSLAGQKLLWFIRGTTVKGKLHQAPRKIKLTPKRQDLERVVEADAFRHFNEREKSERPR